MLTSANGKMHHILRRTTQTIPEMICTLSPAVRECQNKYILLKIPIIFTRLHGSKMAENPDPKQAKSILEFHAVDIDGNDVALSKYEGFVTFIVNLASQ